MGILGFGSARRLEDLKMDDLRKERIVQEVEQDKRLTAIRRSQEDYDRRLEIASRPSVNSAERDVAAYHMTQASRQKVKAEADLQRAITRMTVLDSTMEVIRMKDELQKRGIWRQLNEMDEGALEDQLDVIAFNTKASNNKLEMIVNMLQKDQTEVEIDRGPEFDRAREEIERAAREKGGSGE